MKKMELLAPAGSPDALRAAVASGADAVYIGGSLFSARGGAKNFSDEEIADAVKYCHIRGVAVHVAANILIKEDEIDRYMEYIGYLNKIGADALIIQDIGMASLVKKRFPDIALHASTQMTCASAETAKVLEKAGFSRIVLARELSCREIEEIKKSVLSEIEVFIHGAICISYSGQCLFSSMIGGRSGNRGHCAQPCRLPYRFSDEKGSGKEYLLSPKDMCLAGYINELKEIGVDSLKIEGRLKRPEYVSAVVGVYRKCINENRAAGKAERKELLAAFNRSGFTDGYFTGKPGADMMSYSDPSNISENKFSAEAKERCSAGAEYKKIPISISADAKLGKPIALAVSDGVNEIKVFGNVPCEAAKNTPLTKERIKEQLSKLGNTPYSLKECIAECDEGISVPVSDVNNARRKAVDALSQKRAAVFPRREFDTDIEISNIIPEKCLLSASVITADQARECIRGGIERIYAIRPVIYELANEYPDTEFILRLPPICRNKDVKADDEDKNVMISSIGQIKKDGRKYYGDIRLNIYNSATLFLYKDLECAALSAELSLKEIKSIKKPIDTEIIVYGHIPLMTFGNCPVKAKGRCKQGAGANYIKDRMGEEFPIICYPGCYSVLLNSKPLYMADKAEDLIKTGVKYMRLEFTVEPAKEAKKVIEEYKKALLGKKVSPRPCNTFTRGRFYRPVL